FRLSEALKAIYSLIWDDFCSWYLEWVKPGFEEPIESSVYTKTVEFFSRLMQMLHPFMPFVTEEIYHHLNEKASDDLIIQQFEQIKPIDVSLLQKGEVLKQTISAIRDARNKNNIKPKDIIQLNILTQNSKAFAGIENILKKQINSASIKYVSDTVP